MSCCGEISIAPDDLTDRQSYYMYRCLDRGLVGMTLQFQIEGGTNVQVYCDPTSSAAAYLSVTIGTMAAIMAVY